MPDLVGDDAQAIRTTRHCNSADSAADSRVARQSKKRRLAIADRPPLSITARTCSAEGLGERHYTAARRQQASA